MTNFSKWGAEKSEILTLIFGMLLILVTFGDSHTNRVVGNLDTIFGQTLWPVLDILYPLASISVFLLYGYVKGNGLKINSMTVLLFASFIAVLTLFIFDDILQPLNIMLLIPKTYWIIIMWVYPIYSIFAFFLFGRMHKTIRVAENY